MRRTCNDCGQCDGFHLLTCRTGVVEKLIAAKSIAKASKPEARKRATEDGGTHG